VIDSLGSLPRREFLKNTGLSTAASALAAAAGFPFVVRSQEPLSLRFLTIPDPDGWHPSLRLKGDWLVFEISDGVLSGYGEASHSRQDDQCRQIARSLFARHYRDFDLSRASLHTKELEIAELAPDFVTATAFSGLNQALYDLLAKREQVPVWKLFEARPGLDKLPLYTTINRALQTRSNQEYIELVGALSEQGFRTFKCAPFEKVEGPENAIENSTFGLETLDIIRQRFPDIGIRVDFHERFVAADFFELLPDLESLDLDWIEEPLAMGPVYTELKARTRLAVAGGELFWGNAIFQNLVDNRWVDVIMPDVKHVGGFGPLLEVLDMGRGRIEVSPHNPSGPISTAASLHAAVLFPDSVRSLEYAFDRAGSRRKTGEVVVDGHLYLSDKPGWGIEPAGG